MSLFRRVSVVALALAGTWLSRADAQGIPRNARRLGAPTANAPRLMVANPYPSASQDSAASVAIGDAIRKRMGKNAGSDLTVIPDSFMNAALEQFGYPRNAMLSPMLALTLAKNISARYVLTATVARNEGRFSVTGRLFGVNDDAGIVQVVQQQPQEKVQDFGERVADAFKPAVSVLDDAKACVDQSKTKPDKAREAAAKAIKEQPNHGLAEYCLAQLAKAAGNSDEAATHLVNAHRGDSLSLPVLSQLNEIYAAKGDTAKVLDIFQDMLRVAPTNQPLRDQAFKYMLRAGKPDLAKQVADEGLKTDPFNWDLYDLKSNACLFLSDFKCAIDALEQAFEVDSARADSLFYRKIAVAAAQQPDTARLLRWAGAGVARSPNNVELLGYLNQALVLSGKLDSSLVVTKKLLTLDSTSVEPALAAVQGLANAKRIKEAGPFSDVVVARGTPEQKEQLAAILVNAAAPLLQKETQDFPTAAELTRQCVAIANPAGRVAPSCHFVLGLSAFQVAAAMDAETEKSKSCDMAKKENDLVLEAEKSFNAAQASRPDAVKQYLGYVAQFKPRTASMIKVYCK